MKEASKELAAARILIGKLEKELKEEKINRKLLEDVHPTEVPTQPYGNASHQTSNLSPPHSTFPHSTNIPLPNFLLPLTPAQPMIYFISANPTPTPNPLLEMLAYTYQVTT